MPFSGITKLLTVGSEGGGTQTRQRCGGQDEVEAVEVSEEVGFG